MHENTHENSSRFVYFISLRFLISFYFFKTSKPKYLKIDLSEWFAAAIEVLLLRYTNF